MQNKTQSVDFTSSLSLNSVCIKERRKLCWIKIQGTKPARQTFSGFTGVVKEGSFNPNSDQHGLTKVQTNSKTCFLFQDWMFSLTKISLTW